jgi:hypothetical protein
VHRVTNGCVEMTATAEDLLRQSDVVVIGNPLPEFASLDWSLASRAAVVDCWRCLPREVAGTFARYIPLGRSAADSAADWLSGHRGGQFDLSVN